MTVFSRPATFREGHFFQTAFTNRDALQLHDAKTRNLLPDPFQIAHNRQVQRILSNRPDRMETARWTSFAAHVVANRGAIIRSLPGGRSNRNKTPARLDAGPPARRAQRSNADTSCHPA